MAILVDLISQASLKNNWHERGRGREEGRERSEGKRRKQERDKEEREITFIFINMATFGADGLKSVSR